MKEPITLHRQAQLSLCLCFSVSAAAVEVGTNAVCNAHAQKPVMFMQVEVVFLFK